MTVDQGGDMERYQGIVELDGGGLERAAHEYFERSEQIPTRLRLAAGPLLGRGADRPESWRAGAIMVQHLPRQGGGSPLSVSSGDAPDGHRETVVEDDRWVKARLLLETVEDHELLDPRWHRRSCSIGCITKTASPFTRPTRWRATARARASGRARSSATSSSARAQRDARGRSHRGDLPVLLGAL
jgi:hypothetical protein